MQGFFGKPVDNLFAEPFIARWIRMNVPTWRDAVVVSKNAGGTKRVTSLADTLKLNFGIVTTDRRRPKARVTMNDSTIFFDSIDHEPERQLRHEEKPSRVEPETHSTPVTDVRPITPPGARRPSELDASNEYTDVRVRDVVTGRLVQGHLVDDDYPNPHFASVATSASGGASPSIPHTQENSEVASDPMMNSFISTTSSYQADHALGGTFDAADSSDDEGSVGQVVEQEKTITLVGEVRDRTVFIVDDMIDKAGSWIAAAETVVKKGGAKKVYCIATHALLGDDSLDEMEACDCIDYIVVTNTFPISPRRMSRSKKLVVIDISSLLAESIRRHHYGERYVGFGLSPTSLRRAIGACR